MKETVEEFLARGKTIQIIPMGKTTCSPITGLPEKEHNRVINSATKGARKKKAGKKKRTKDTGNE